MRIPKRQVTLSQIYSTLVNFLIISLVFPVVSIIGMIAYTHIDNYAVYDKYVNVESLPDEILNGIDYENNVYRSIKGTIIDIDIVKYKDSYQIAFTSVRNISKELEIQTNQERMENGLVAFFIISLIFAIVIAMLVAIAQVRGGRII